MQRDTYMEPFCASAEHLRKGIVQRLNTDINQLRMAWSGSQPNWFAINHAILTEAHHEERIPIEEIGQTPSLLQSQN